MALTLNVTCSCGTCIGVSNLLNFELKHLFTGGEPRIITFYGVSPFFCRYSNLPRIPPDLQFKSGAMREAIVYLVRTKADLAAHPGPRLS